MLGYLKRGDAYRRRSELDAAIRDLRTRLRARPDRAAAARAAGRRQLRRRTVLLPAAQHYEAYVALDDRSPRVLYKLALSRYRAGQPTLGNRLAAKGDRASTTGSRKRTTCSACASATHGRTPTRSPRSSAPSRFRRRCCRRARSWPICTERSERGDDWIGQLEALRALDPGPARDVTLGLAYARARPVGPRGDSAAPRRRASSRSSLYLRRPRPGLARGSAGAIGDRVALSKALEALEQAIGIDDSSEAFTLFGRALLLASDEELAERMLQHATERMPVDPLAFYYLADAAERRAAFRRRAPGAARLPRARRRRHRRPPPRRTRPARRRMLDAR